MDKKEIHLVVLPTGKIHISFSELSEFFSCSWKHYVHQILKIDKQIPSPSLIFGICTHSGGEKYLKTRILDVKSCVDDLRKMWLDAQNKTQKDLDIDDEKYKKYQEDFSNEELEKAVKQITSILNDIPKFLDETFPGWEYIEAEHLLYEDVEGTNNKFKGYIDGILSYKGKRNKKNYILLDWKTSNSGWRKEQKQDLMKRNQLVFYKHFWSIKNVDIQFKDIRCGFVILNRGAKSGKHCEFLPVSVGEVTEQRAVKLIKGMLYSMKKGLKVKNRYSCMWCEYFNTKHCKNSVHRVLG